jgi:hypothetical protein
VKEILMKPAAPAALAATLAALIAAALTGCSSPRSDASAPRRSTRALSTTPSLSARAAAEHDALAAYRGLWKAFVHAGRTADASDPMLSRYAEGAALDTITDDLKKSKASGQIIKGRLTLRPTVTKFGSSRGQSEVDVKDCVDDTKWLVYHNNGGLVDHQPGGKHLVVAVVTDTQGVWKVSGLAAHGVGTCT